MKISGIPWIGDVPEVWDARKIGALYTPRNVKVSDSEFPPLSVTKQGILPQLEHVAKSNDRDNRKLVKEHDFVINSRSDRRGSCGIAKQDGSVSLINIVLQPLGEMEPQYFDWLFHTTAFADEFYKWGQGIDDDVWSTHWTSMKKIVVPFPPLPEQRVIAERIDCEAARIVALREKIKREIERLGDYKKSLIAETVSKGLHKRKLKPSGIPWLGDVPEEWEVIPLFKLVCQVKLPNDGMVEKNLLSLSYGRIIRKDMETASGLVPENYAGYNRIEANDIVLRLTDLQNDQKSLRVGLSHERGIVTSAYLTIRSNADCIADYLAYVIKVFDFKKGFYGIGSGVRQSLKFSEVKKILIALPPLPEQREIAEYLDRAVSRIDAVVARRKAQLEKLEAFKRSLIQEYVTGKREVRQ